MPGRCADPLHQRCEAMPAGLVAAVPDGTGRWHYVGFFNLVGQGASGSINPDALGRFIN